MVKIYLCFLAIAGSIMTVSAVPRVLPDAILSESASSDPNLPKYHIVPTPFNWMNDPNGLFYDVVHGLYHAMYQYKTPRVWGHSVSKDLVHWTQLPVALDNDAWYDKGGVYSGSATILDDVDRTPVLSYSVSTNDMQALAFPKNRSDPYLTEWVKYDGNPIISSRSPNGSAPTGRDPTTAWYSQEHGRWIMAYGTTTGGSDGGAVLFSSPDFHTWTQEHRIHTTDKTGMWECPDFFAIPGARGDVTHMIKASTGGREFWVTGSYNATSLLFTPHDPNSDIGTDDQLLDYGRFYASKSFYDPSTSRQILFGWLLEERPVNPDGSPFGWASVQSIPRSIELASDGVRLVTPPIRELEYLRVSKSHIRVTGVTVSSAKPLTMMQGAQSEIRIVFGSIPSNVTCGLRVRAANDQSEFTLAALSASASGDLTLVTDTTHGSTNKTLPTSRTVAPLPGVSGSGEVELRVFVDASVIESFAAGGVSAMARRVYPTGVSDGVFIVAEGGACDVIAADAWQLAL